MILPHFLCCLFPHVSSNNDSCNDQTETQRIWMLVAPLAPPPQLGFIICKISENHLYNWRQRGADRQGIQSAVGEIPFSGYRLQTLSHSSWSTHSILATGNSIIQWYNTQKKKYTQMQVNFGFLAFLRMKLYEGDIWYVCWWLRSEYFKFSNARYVGSEGYKVWRWKYICLRTNTLICIYLHCGNGRPSQIALQFPPSFSLALKTIKTKWSNKIIQFRSYLIWLRPHLHRGTSSHKLCYGTIFSLDSQWDHGDHFVDCLEKNFLSFHFV